MVSPSSNNLSTILPNAGQSFAVGNLEIQANTIDNAMIQTGAVSAANLAKSVSQLATIVLTPTQIKGMYATPVQVIAASGAGSSIFVDYAIARFTYTTPAYTSGGAIQLQYGNTANAGGTAACNTLAASVVTASASSDTLIAQGSSNITATQNTAIFVSNATNAFATGTVSTLTLFVYYSIL